MNKNSILVLTGGVAIGVLLAMSYVLYQDTKSMAEPTEKQPLYWVAPMDSSYRRDKPGKSPMGMDLVPVYEDGSDDQGDNAIKISPAVINNLGVRTSEVTSGPIDTEIRTVGYVKYDEDQLVHVHPRVSGWIEKLYVKTSGDPVDGGEPLYELYSPELVNAQEELLHAISRSNQRLVSAAEERLIALQFEESQIEALKKDRLVRQVVKFAAPQSGVVDHLQIREGYFVKPGTTMMSIAKLDEVWVEAEVFERQAAFVSKDAEVLMSLDYFPGREWVGKVDYVYPTLNPTTRTVRLRLRFQNSDRALKPNMFARISIIARAKKDSINIPAEALIRTGSQERVVLSLGDGRFKSVEVKSGVRTFSDVEIIDGLQVGDSVVTSAQFLIDSESSKTSDFMRLSMDHDEPKTIETVEVHGRIESVMKGHRMATITHEAIPEWGWPAMTMDFLIAESVDIEKVNPKVEATFEIRRAESTNEIVGLMLDDEVKVNDLPSARVSGLVNSLDRTSRVANITRGAIEKWQRGPATMDFYFSESVDLENVSPTDNIDFTFTIKDGRFIIVRLHVDEHPKEPAGDHAGHEGHAS